MADLVVGVDAGGTTTRCVVASADGTVLGRGQAAGANQRSSGPDAAARLSEAVRGALGGLDPHRIAAGMFGIAGAGAAGHAAAQGMADSAWRTAGLPGRPAVVTDIAVAFAAGTPARDGAVLISGTGAVAAAVSGGDIAARCDGYGWLLGDEGSAVWLGRAAVRAALAAMDGRGQPTSLVSQVTRTLLGENPQESPGQMPGEPAASGESPGDQHSADALAQALVAVVYDRSPAQLGLLAPVVARAARSGDPVAAALVGDAAERLLAAAEAVRRAAPRGSPTVLAGSLLRSGPVSDSVRAGLSERGIEPLTASEGVLGAAILALRHLGHRQADVAAAHDRLAATLTGTQTR